MIHKRVFPVLLALTVHISAPAAVTVSISNQDVMRGATVDVPVRVQTLLAVDSLIAYQAVLVFNATIIQAVGASKNGTMTQNWGDPTVGIKGDTIRVAGITTNQPSKKWVADDGKLFNLNFFILGDLGSVTTVKIFDIKLFSKTGAITVTGKTDGQLTIVTNPATATINLNLYPGLNFVSFPVTPDTSALPRFLKGLPVNYVWGYYSGYPKSWALNRPLNTLNSVDGMHGYWIRQTDVSMKTLAIPGAPLAVSTPVFMVRGLNLIGYFPNAPDKIAHSLASLDTNYSYVWTYSAADGRPSSWQRRRPLNTLSALAPLLAYWMRISNPATLVYPSSGYSLVKASFPTFETAAVGDGDHISTTEWCDFWALQPEFLHEGDSIRVYDKQRVVCGDTTVNQDGGFIMAVAGDDPLTQDIDEGADPGEDLKFEINGIPVEVTGASANFDTTIIPGGKPIWQQMGSLRVKFGSTPDGLGESTTPADQPASFHLSQNHPNPFNPYTVIQYALPVSGEVELNLFDVRGQSVATLFHGFQKAGDHSEVWNGKDDNGVSVPSGIYLYTLRAGKVMLVKKCLLLK